MTKRRVMTARAVSDIWKNLKLEEGTDLEPLLAATSRVADALERLADQVEGEPEPQEGRVVNEAMTATERRMALRAVAHRFGTAARDALADDLGWDIAGGTTPQPFGPHRTLGFEARVRNVMRERHLTFAAAIAHVREEMRHEQNDWMMRNAPFTETTETVRVPQPQFHHTQWAPMRINANLNYIMAAPGIHPADTGTAGAVAAFDVETAQTPQNQAVDPTRWPDGTVIADTRYGDHVAAGQPARDDAALHNHAMEAQHEAIAEQRRVAGQTLTEEVPLPFPPGAHLDLHTQVIEQRAADLAEVERRLMRDLLHRPLAIHDVMAYDPTIWTAPANPPDEGMEGGAGDPPDDPPESPEGEE